MAPGKKLDRPPPIQHLVVIMDPVSTVKADEASIPFTSALELETVTVPKGDNSVAVSPWSTSVRT
jgi:hypothetical protein